jgi:predicted short-subunit dehydrogenase-like oxidoreductase (DUF2520 family)
MINAKQQIKRITLIGAGNIAHSLGRAFRQSGFLIHEVYSRSQESAVQLSKALNCNFVTRLDKLDARTHLFFVAVNDDAIGEVLHGIPHKEIFTVHSSGANSLAIFEGMEYKNYGIFYPVQSFSKESPESLSPIPICVEGNNDNTTALLKSMASSLSNKVYELNSEKRKALHVAAVFANNFSNHLFHIAKQVLDKENIDFEILRPLIERTAKKIKSEDPYDIQSGPARRKDERTIGEHLNYLSSEEDLQKIYKMLSEHISNTYHK